MHTIYVLKCPVTRRVRYVGATRQRLEKRLVGHVSEARTGKLWPRCHWIRKLLSAGTLPLIEIVELVQADQWQTRERYWIAEFGGMGRLLNCTTGGDGGRIFSKETRAKIANSKVGKKRGPHSRDHRAKISRALIGHPGASYRHSEEAKRKISAARQSRIRC